jgi:hypothetical protein
MHLSAGQLILCLIAFRSDTPRECLEENDNEDCANELQKIYSSVSRRIEENELLRSIIYAKRTQYPSYKDLLTKQYRAAFLRGLILISLRNCSGYASMIPIIDHVYASVSEYLNNIFGLIIILAIFIPLLVVSCGLIVELGYRAILLTCSVGMSITVFTCFLLQVTTSSWAANGDLLAAILTILGLSYLFYGTSLYKYFLSVDFL